MVAVGQLAPTFLAVFFILSFVIAFRTILQHPAHLPGGSGGACFTPPLAHTTTYLLTCLNFGVPQFKQYKQHGNFQVSTFPVKLSLHTLRCASSCTSSKASAVIIKNQ